MYVDMQPNQSKTKLIVHVNNHGDIWLLVICTMQVLSF